MKVFIIAAVTADGLMGAHETHRSLDWRSKEDSRFFIDTTKASGVMVMGAATYKTFRLKRAPPGRRLIVYTHHPEEIVGENIETTSEDPRALVDRLANEGYESLAVCGGAMVNSMFLDAGLVDEMYLTVEPVLFGAGVPLLRNATQRPLALLDCTKLNDSTLLLRYTVRG